MHVLALSCFGFLCQAVILISIQIAYGLFVALLMLLMMFSYCVINSLFPFLTSIFLFTLCLPIYLSSCIICILIITLPMKWIFKPYTYNKKMKFDKQRPTVSVQVKIPSCSMCPAIRARRSAQIILVHLYARRKGSDGSDSLILTVSAKDMCATVGLTVTWPIWVLLFSGAVLAFDIWRAQHRCVVNNLPCPHSPADSPANKL